MREKNIMSALEIMGKGMLAIFIVIIILTLIVVLLSFVSKLPFFKKSKK